MSEVENETVIGKIVEQANIRNLDEMLEYFTDDVMAQWHGGEIRDKKGIREIFERSFTVWSDGIYRVDRMISEDDTVVAEVHWTGVHTGELVGTIDRSIGRIPGTGKRVELVEVWIADFKDGKVKTWKLFYNPNIVLQQLQE